MEGWSPAIAVDRSGNVYVSCNGGGGWGSPPLNPAHGGTDVFVGKLNSKGIQQWNTFLGGISSDYSSSIVVDGTGNIYVAGASHKTWGTPLNAFEGTWDGVGEVFVAKLSSSGALQWNTFIGGSHSDAFYIMMDGSSNVCVVGKSSRNWGSPLKARGPMEDDVFVAKLNTYGAVQWNTFMGCEGSGGIAVDGSGNIYVLGVERYTSNNSWVNGVFVAILNNNGIEIEEWNRFIQADSCSNIATQCH